MTPGISGTGPYAEIRRLRREIQDCHYEIGLIASGMRRRLGRKELEQIIIDKRERIKQINVEMKAKKSVVLKG